MTAPRGCPSPRCPACRSRGWPSRDGTGTSTPGGPYQYIGQLACFYLDYLDTATGHTLAPVPGGYYTMIAVNSRAGLTVPPPGRPWNPGNAGAGGTFAALFLKRAVPPEISHGHYPGATCAHCDPGAPHRPLPPRRTPGPDFAPQDYAAALAEGGRTTRHCRRPSLCRCPRRSRKAPRRTLPSRPRPRPRRRSTSWPSPPPGRTTRHGSQRRRGGRPDGC